MKDQRLAGGPWRALATGTADRLTGIEASRGVAAGLVIVYHVARHLDKASGAPLLRSLLQFGHAGVDFFFVISGFIILFVHYDDVGQPARLSRYAKRRFTRLAPTYWVALALTLLLTFAGHNAMPSLVEIAWSASLLPSDQEMVLGVAWTLRYEVLFYALFCVLILNRAAGLAIMAIWLSCTVLATIFSYENAWLPSQFHGAYNLEFFLGMGAAWLLRHRAVVYPGWLAAAGIALFGVSGALEGFQMLDGHGGVARLAYGIPSAFIVLGLGAMGLASTGPRRPWPVPAVLRRIGAASYSLYLFQFVFIGMVWKLLVVTHLHEILPVLAQFFLLSAAAIGGGVLMSEWVEHPLMNRIRTWSAPARVRPGMG